MCRKWRGFQIGRFNSDSGAIFSEVLIATPRGTATASQSGMHDGIRDKNGRQSRQFLVGRWNATSAVFFGTRLDSVEQLVKFLDEHGEPFLVLFLGDKIAEVLHALFSAVV